MLVYILVPAVFFSLAIITIMVKLYRRSENYRQKVVELDLENTRLTSSLQHERAQALAKIETLQQAHQQ